MLIEKHGRMYYARGQGLEAQGKTAFIAISRLLKEIFDMRALYAEYGLELTNCWYKRA